MDDNFQGFALHYTGRGVENAGRMGERFGNEATGVVKLRHFVVVQFKPMQIV